MISIGTYHRSEHLVESQLGPLLDSCPLCRSTRFVGLGKLQTDPIVVLNSCLECHCAFASRIPTDEALKNYYGGYYRNRGGADKITFDNSLRLSKHILRKVSHVLGHGRSRIKILDFGGGDGSVSLQLAVLGMSMFSWTECEVTVVDFVEPNPKYFKEGVRAVSVSDLSQVSENDFDIILASASIEHLRDPALTLRNLFEKMAPEGVFYARTPDMVGFFKVFTFLGLKFDFTFPAHIFNFGRKFWKVLPSLLGLENEIQTIRSTPSIVESSFREHFFSAFAAFLFKAPFYLGLRSFPFVGGWEVFFKKNHDRV